ncbi:hypothetical protein FVE24_15100, partial [Parageobacillus sp. SY1]
LIVSTVCDHCKDVLSRIQVGCNKEFPISMSRLYHLTSWHGNKKSEQCHVKQNCNLYRSFKRVRKGRISEKGVV